MHSVVIIIPTLLHQPTALRKCLQSCSHLQLPPRTTIEVLVVSGASASVTEVFETEVLPSFGDSISIRFLRLPWNMGFAGAANAGIQESTAEFVLLLNESALVHRNWVVELLETHQATGNEMVASIVYKADGQTIESCGFGFAWRGRAEALKPNNKHQLTCSLSDDPDYWLKHPEWLDLDRLNVESTSFEEPFGPDIAGSLYTRRLFDEVGQFNESFFASLADVDLALRARLAGFRCAWSKAAHVVHNQHQTFARGPLLQRWQHAKNWWHIVHKTYPSIVWKTLRLAILAERAKNLGKKI